MIRLMVNADDFGLTDGVCSGIIRAINAGGVTATTAMVCVPGAVDRLRHWAPAIAGRIGAHLQLTSGTPVLPPERVRSLILDDSNFPSRRKEVREPKPDEILSEWRAQMELLLQAGIQPTHLDSHHHIHRLPAVLPAFLEIAKQYKLPARSVDPEMTAAFRAAGVPCADATLTDWYGGKLSAASLVEVVTEGVRKYPGAKSFELMCHPGFSGSDLERCSRYTADREQELAVLCDPALQERLAAEGFSLTSVQVATANPPVPVPRHRGNGLPVA